MVAGKDDNVVSCHCEVLQEEGGIVNRRRGDWK